MVEITYTLSDFGGDAVAAPPRQEEGEGKRKCKRLPVRRAWCPSLERVGAAPLTAQPRAHQLPNCCRQEQLRLRTGAESSAAFTPSSSGDSPIVSAGHSRQPAAAREPYVDPGRPVERLLYQGGAAVDWLHGDARDVKGDGRVSERIRRGPDHMLRYSVPILLAAMVSDLGGAILFI